jgi:malonate-semialdehyde dehydrogenase (acetylating)/methylmalonate-semialdehyde dehydrogenase
MFSSASWSTHRADIANPRRSTARFPTPWGGRRGLENISSRAAGSLLKRVQRTGIDRRRRLPIQPLASWPGHPFNFPAMVPMWMFANATCGNTFVLKPSEGPGASLYGRPAEGSGLPDGVFNVVQGDKVAVDAILDTDDRGGELRRFHADRAVLSGNGTATGSGQALGGEEPHDRAAGRGHKHGGRRGRLPGVRLGGRAVHGDLVIVAVGDVADPCRGDQERLPKEGRPAAIGVSGTARDARARDKVAGYLTPRASGGDGRHGWT